jgi:hypothetical protein
MNQKKAKTTLLATLFLSAVIIVCLNSANMAFATQTPTESSQSSISGNETLPQTNQSLTQTNSTTPQSTLGNSTSDSDDLDALSRVSHPTILATPYVAPTYTTVNPTSTPHVNADLNNFDTTLNASEIATMPTSEPASKSSILDPQTPVLPSQSPQPAIAPVATAKVFLSQAVFAIALIVAASTIAVASYVTRKNKAIAKNTNQNRHSTSK